MSGYTDHAALHSELIEAGGTFLGKPFTRADLASRVGRCSIPSDADEVVVAGWRTAS